MNTVEAYKVPVTLGRSTTTVEVSLFTSVLVLVFVTVSQSIRSAFTVVVAVCVWTPYGYRNDEQNAEAVLTPWRIEDACMSSHFAGAAATRSDADSRAHKSPAIRMYQFIAKS